MADELQQAPADAQADLPPPAWDDVKAAPEFQQLDPNQQFTTYQRWRSATLQHASQNFSDFDPNVQREFVQAQQPELERLAQATGQYNFGHPDLQDHFHNLPQDKQPEGFWGTLGRTVATRAFPTVATVGGALGGGLLGIESGPGAIATAGLGGAAAGIGAEALQKNLMGDEWFNNNQKQIEVNAQAHPVAHQIGTMLTFLASTLGGGEAKAGAQIMGKVIGEDALKQAAAEGTKLMPYLFGAGERAIAGGAQFARAGAVGAAEEKGDFSLAGRREMAGEAARGAVIGGALGLFPAAKTLLGSVLKGATTDSAAMALAGGMYDQATTGQPIDWQKIANETKGNAPAFAIQNAILGWMHGMPMRIKSGEAAPPENKPVAPSEELNALKARQQQLQEKQQTGQLAPDQQKELEDLNKLAEMKGEQPAQPAQPAPKVPGTPVTPETPAQPGEATIQPEAQGGKLFTPEYNEALDKLEKVMVDQAQKRGEQRPKEINEAIARASSLKEAEEIAAKSGIELTPEERVAVEDSLQKPPTSDTEQLIEGIREGAAKQGVSTKITLEQPPEKQALVEQVNKGLAAATEPAKEEAKQQPQPRVPEPAETMQDVLSGKGDQTNGWQLTETESGKVHYQKDGEPYPAELEGVHVQPRRAVIPEAQPQGNKASVEPEVERGPVTKIEPLEAHNEALSDQAQRLSALADDYKAGKISGEEFHRRTAEIVSESMPLGGAVLPKEKVPKAKTKAPTVEEPTTEPLLPFPTKTSAGEDINVAPKKQKSAAAMWAKTLEDGALPKPQELSKAFGDNETTKKLTQELKAALKKLYPEEMLPEGATKVTGFASVPTEEGKTKTQPYFSNDIEGVMAQLRQGWLPKIPAEIAPEDINPRILYKRNPDGSLEVTGVNHPEHGELHTTEEVKAVEGARKAKNRAVQEKAGTVATTLPELTEAGKERSLEDFKNVTPQQLEKLNEWMKSHGYTENMPNDPTGELHDAIQARVLRVMLAGNKPNNAYIKEMIKTFEKRQGEGVKAEIPTQESGRELRSTPGAAEGATPTTDAELALKKAGVADPQALLDQINEGLQKRGRDPMTMEDLAAFHGSKAEDESGEAAAAPNDNPVVFTRKGSKEIEHGEYVPGEGIKDSNGNLLRFGQDIGSWADTKEDMAGPTAMEIADRQERERQGLAAATPERTTNPITSLQNKSKLFNLGFDNKQDPVGESLRTLAKEGNTLEKFVANLMLKSGVDWTKVKVFLDDHLETRGNYSGDAAKNSFKIYLNPSVNHGAKGIEGTLLHEAYHHITTWKLADDYAPNKYEAAAIRQLKGIMNAGREAAFKEIFGRDAKSQEEADKFVQFLQHPNDPKNETWALTQLGLDKMLALKKNFDRYYPLANLKEMATGIVAPEFHDFISKTKPTPVAQGGAFKNLLQQFRAFLTKLVAGRPTPEAEKLNHYLEAAATLGVEPPRTRGVQGTEAVPIASEKPFSNYEIAHAKWFNAARDAAKLRGSSESLLRRIDSDIHLIKEEYGTPFQQTHEKETLEEASKWLGRDVTKVGEAKEAIQDKIREAEHKETQQYIGRILGLIQDGNIKEAAAQAQARLGEGNSSMYNWRRSDPNHPKLENIALALNRAEPNVGLATREAERALGKEAVTSLKQDAHDQEIKWDRDQTDRLFESTKAGMERAGIPISRGGAFDPKVELVRESQRTLAQNPTAATDRMAAIKSGEHGMTAKDVALFHTYDAQLFKAWKDAAEAGVGEAEAKQKFLNFSKDFDEETSKAGETLQSLKGAIDIDTGTYQGLEYAYFKKFGKELPPHMKDEASQIVDKSHAADIAALSNSIKEGQAIAKLSQGISDELGAKKTKLTLAEKAAAAKVGVPEKDGQLTFDLGDPKDPYAKLKAYLAARFGDKPYKIGKENLTTQEVGQIWKYIKAIYLDGSLYVRPDELREAVATDLNIDKRLVDEAISRPKTLNKFVNDRYVAQAQQRAIAQITKQWMEESNKHPAVKVLSKLWELPRSVAVVGHVNPSLTHAGGLLFRPSTWKTEIPSIMQAFRAGFLGGKGLDAKGYHESQLQQVMQDPNYGLFTKNGLAAKVGALDDIGQYNSHLGRLGVAGNRAMDILKVLRMQRANEEYQRIQNKPWFAALDQNGKNQVLKEMMSAINSETGTTTPGFTRTGRLLTGDWRMFMFAPRLEGARWQQMIVDPIRAAGLWAKGSKATEGEKWFRSYTTRRLVEQMGTMTAALAANAMVLKAIGSDDKINFTDPTRSDWMAFKVNGQTTVAPSSFLAPLRLSLSVALSHVIPSENRQPALDKIASYAFGKVTPTISDMYELARAKQNYTGRPLDFLPWAPEQKLTAREQKDPISWYRYAMTKGPIPLSATVEGWYNALEEQGAEPEIAKTIIGASLAAVSGMFAVHQHPTPPEKTTQR